MPRYPDQIEYSEVFDDDIGYCYRNVYLPKTLTRDVWRITTGRHPRLLKEDEWRKLGVQQSRGWEHYEVHHPEPHILLFRRPRHTDPATGVALDVIVTVEAEQVDGSEVITCRSMAGRVLHSMKAQPELTAADLLMSVSVAVKVPEGYVKAVLSSGQMLSDFPRTALISEIL